MSLDRQGVPLLRDPDFLRLWSIGLIVSLVRWLEILVFGVPFGALAARISRRQGLAGMLSILTATALVLLFMAASERLAVWHLGVASFIGGLVWAADNPVRRAMMGDVAGPARMGNAMAFDVGASNASRLLGPAAGGLLLAHFGMSAVFGLVVLLHVVGILALLHLRERVLPREPVKSPILATVAAGFLAARDNPRLAGALWITIVFNLFGWPVLSMVPVIGQDRLDLAAAGIGLLASMDGVGSLLGALALARLARPAIQGRLYVCGLTLFLAMLPLFALSTHPFWAAAALLVVGIGQSAFSIMQATIVFVAAPVERRMQAMGLLTMCIGTGPVGFLMLGWLAERLGASHAAVISCLAGLASLAVTWPWWRECWRDGRAVRG